MRDQLEERITAMEKMLVEFIAVTREFMNAVSWMPGAPTEPSSRTRESIAQITAWQKQVHNEHVGLLCTCGYGGYHEPNNPRCDLNS